MNSAQLMWGVLFSSIGLGYFMYGKKITNPAFRYTGLSLMLYPIAVSGTWALVGIGVVLVLVPHVVRF